MFDPERMSECEIGDRQQATGNRRAGAGMDEGGGRAHVLNLPAHGDEEKDDEVAIGRVRRVTELRL